MLISRLDQDTVAITKLDRTCCELLTQIVSSADPGDSDAARARIFSTPTHGREPGADRDWHEYVEPDLARLFQGALEIVQADLAEFPPDNRRREHTLHLPVKNLEAWIHALNQARLAIAARYDFTEEDMDAPLSLISDARTMALFQMHFYGFLQECFLRQLD